MAKRKPGLLPDTLRQLQDVGIYFFGKRLWVDPDTVEIYISKGHQVFWTMYGDARIHSIDFHPSPFDGPIQIQPDGKHALSPPVTNPIHGNKHFKYSVTVVDPGGKKYKVDPVVDVMP